MGRHTSIATVLEGTRTVRKNLTQMIKSKVSSKAQTTLPRSVRAALHIVEGDELLYVVDGDRVVLTKAQPRAGDDPFAAFDEWASDNDARAYADL